MCIEVGGWSPDGETNSTSLPGCADTGHLHLGLGLGAQHETRTDEGTQSSAALEGTARPPQVGFPLVCSVASLPPDLIDCARCRAFPRGPAAAHAAAQVLGGSVRCPRPREARRAGVRVQSSPVLQDSSPGPRCPPSHHTCPLRPASSCRPRWERPRSRGHGPRVHIGGTPDPAVHPSVPLYLLLPAPPAWLLVPLGAAPADSAPGPARPRPTSRAGSAAGSPSLRGGRHSPPLGLPV